MGWAVSYELRRPQPLTEAERETVRKQVKKYARIKWEVEPYALELPEAGEVVARGITKVPWKTGHRNWATLLKAITELRMLIPGTTCDVSDDHEAVSWDEAAQVYSIGDDGDDDDDDDDGTYRPSSGATWYRWNRLEKSDGNVYISKDETPRLEVTGDKAWFTVFLADRSTVASTIEHVWFTFLDGTGAVLQTIEQSTSNGLYFDLQAGVGAAIAGLDMSAESRSTCAATPVAMFTCAPITELGPVELVPADMKTRYPRVALALTATRVDDPPALAFEVDGSQAGVASSAELEIIMMVLTDTGMELERTSVRGRLAGHHALTLPMAADRIARVRRIDVRITGLLAQRGRVAKWELTVAGGPRPKASKP